MDPLLFAVIVAAILVPIAIHKLTSGRKDKLADPVPQRAMMQSESIESLTARVNAELALGNKIEAVKLFREATGESLANAKDAVERIGAGGLNDTAWGSAPSSSSLRDIEAEVRALIRQDRLLDAIKLTRDRAGLGLKEARDFVERLRR